MNYKFLFLLILTNSQLLYAANLRTVSFDPSLVEAQAHLNITGKLKLKSSHYRFQGSLVYKSNGNIQQKCFYLPFNDLRKKDLSYSPLKHLDKYFKEIEKKDLPAQITHVLADKHPDYKIEKIAPHIIKINKTSHSSNLKGNFEFEFASFIKSSGKGDMLIEDFHPIPLESCPRDAKLISAPLKLAERLKIGLKVDSQDSFQVLGPGMNHAVSSRIQNFSVFSEKIALFIGNSFNFSTIKIGNINVSLFMKSKVEPSFIRTLRGAFYSHTNLFGKFPYESMTIIESSAIHKADISGVIVLNKARQYLFQYLQEDYLNWKHWVLSTLLASQWFGSSIKVLDNRDQWFLAGVCDFATLVYLKNQPNRMNLFNHFDSETNILSFNYKQIQDIIASFLFRESPHAALTDENLLTITDKKEQNPLIFIKHAITLRFLNFTMGREKFRAFIQEYAIRHKSKNVLPSSFYFALKDSSYEKSTVLKERYANYLKDYWMQEGWPDYSLEELNTKKIADGKWLAEAVIHSDSSHDSPTQLRFSGKSGRNYLVTSILKPTKKNEFTRVSLLTDEEVNNVEIDPFHKIFDSNRFNNDSYGPRFSIFPLGTNTLSDQSYTSIWLPYIFRRPGEGTSLAVQAAILKYLNSGFFTKFEISPSTKKASFQGRLDYALPKIKAVTHLSVLHTYENYRVMEASIYKSLLDGYLMNLLAHSSLRYRHISGEKGSEHPTLSLGLIGENIPLYSESNCLFTGGVSVEKSPYWPNSRYRYTRYKGTAGISCQIANSYLYSVKHFRGYLDNQSLEYPNSAGFRINQLDEAGVRLDRQQKKPLEKIYSINQDLLIPFKLPFGEKIMLLSDKLKFRLFFDSGFTSARDLREYESSGLGFVLPFGGDIVGIGSLTISRFSLLGILYEKNQDNISYKPQIVFDLSGEL